VDFLIFKKPTMLSYTNNKQTDKDAEVIFLCLRIQRLLRQKKITLEEISDLKELKDPDVTVIIPARNEEKTIETVVKECLNYASQVIVINGNSTDKTEEMAHKAGAKIIQDQGIGKGAALKIAVTQVTTPICVFVDADGSHDPIDIPLLVAPIKANKADHVTGSRLLGGSDELHGGGDEFLRLAGSAFITYLINLKFKTKISDSQNGFRAIRTDLFKKLKLTSKHTTIEMELIMQTLATGHILTEIPTHERPRAAGFSKISLKNPNTWLNYGWYLIKGLFQKIQK
jgi:dolichol-phosphate mannosyltransferase